MLKIFLCLFLCDNVEVQKTIWIVSVPIMTWLLYITLPYQIEFNFIILNYQISSTLHDTKFRTTITNKSARTSPDQLLLYAENANKVTTIKYQIIMQQILFFFRKNPSYMVLFHPTCLFIFEKFSYLHVCNILFKKYIYSFYCSRCNKLYWISFKKA